MFQAVSAIVTVIFKEGAPFYFSSMIFTAFLLFVSTSVLDRIGLSALVQEYRGYIGAVFVLSASLLAPRAFNIISSPFVNWSKERNLYRNVISNINSMTEEEKSYIRAFVDDGRNTIHVPISDGIMGGLHAKGLVFRPTSVGNSSSWPYNLQPIVRKILEKDPGLLR